MAEYRNVSAIDYEWQPEGSNQWFMLSQYGWGMERFSLSEQTPAIDTSGLANKKATESSRMRIPASATSVLVNATTVHLFDKIGSAPRGKVRVTRRRNAAGTSYVRRSFDANVLVNLPLMGGGELQRYQLGFYIDGELDRVEV